MDYLSIFTLNPGGFCYTGGVIYFPLHLSNDYLNKVLLTEEQKKKTEIISKRSVIFACVLLTIKHDT